MTKLERRLTAHGLTLDVLADQSFGDVVRLATLLRDPDRGDPLAELHAEAVSVAAVVADDRRRRDAAGLLAAEQAITEARFCVVAALAAEHEEKETTR